MLVSTIVPVPPSGQPPGPLGPLPDADWPPPPTKILRKSPGSTLRTHSVYPPAPM